MKVLKIKFLRHFQPKEAIELDRFVHRLIGEPREVITRHSGQVASTMKQEHGMTVNRSVGAEEELEKYNVKLFPRMAQMIRDYQTIGSSAVLDTFCGLPHHLLLPR